MFSLFVENLTWIQDHTDDPSDLCAHGEVTLTIGDRQWKDECTVSSGVLYMLRSLTEDHAIHHELQMLPCCGFSMVPNQEGKRVDIIGCPNGIDWDVKHDGDKVILTMDDESRYEIPLEQYREAVFSLADQVEAFYAGCSPKEPMAEDEQVYRMFWEEWHLLRGK